MEWIKTNELRELKIKDFPCIRKLHINYVQFKKAAINFFMATWLEIDLTTEIRLTVAL